MHIRKSTKIYREPPRVQIEEALRHVRGCIETAQTAVVSPNASPVAISDTLAVAVHELDRATNLIAGNG